MVLKVPEQYKALLQGFLNAILNATKATSVQMTAVSELLQIFYKAQDPKKVDINIKTWMDGNNHAQLQRTLETVMLINLKDWQFSRDDVDSAMRYCKDNFKPLMEMFRLYRMIQAR